MTLLGSALPAATQAKPKRKPKTFTAEGLIVGTGVVAHSNFIFQCPAPAKGANHWLDATPLPPRR